MTNLTTATLLTMMFFSHALSYAEENYSSDNSSDVEEIADSDDQSEESNEAQEPPTRRMRDSELSAENDFNSFEQGPYFHPPHHRRKHFFGYEHHKDFFKDFKDDVLTENEDVAVCEGEDSEDADGAVKLTFVCDDGDYEYSCYADLISNAYSVSIPSEVLGLSCKIQVEAIEAEDDDSDIEVDGSVTEDEVDLDSESNISIDVEE